MAEGTIKRLTDKAMQTTRGQAADNYQTILETFFPSEKPLESAWSVSIHAVRMACIYRQLVW